MQTSIHLKDQRVTYKPNYFNFSLISASYNFVCVLLLNLLFLLEKNYQALDSYIEILFEMKSEDSSISILLEIKNKYTKFSISFEGANQKSSSSKSHVTEPTYFILYVVSLFFLLKLFFDRTIINKNVDSYTQIFH